MKIPAALAATHRVSIAVRGAVLLAALCAALPGSARAQGAPAQGVPAQGAPGGAPALPTRINLQCIGWMPSYANWLQPQPPPGSGQTTQLSIQIDRATRSISSALEMIGPVAAPLQVSDRYYAGIAPIGRLLANRTLDSVELSVNRVTGEGRLRYLVGESTYTAFDGKCAVAPE